MTREVPLSRGLVALVDEEDVDRVFAARPWAIADCAGKLYARHWYRDQFDVPRTIYMHTLLTGWSLVDHKNGDGLDNRRSNLRAATPSQNNANSARQSRNSSGYKGVTLFKRTGKYRAYIGTGHRQIHIGYFDTPEQAARAYDSAALAHFGEFARLNFPGGIAS